MAEVINMPADSLEGRNDTNDNSKKSSDGPESSVASPLKRRADREIRGRRDEREVDRAPARHGTGDYHDRSRSSPPPASSDKDYKRRASPSPPLPFRDRRHSPPRRSPPFPPFKRSRRDDAGYDRRGSPRGGYGPGDRRFGYDSYEREMGGRLGYGDDRHGRFGRPSDWEQGRGYGDASNTGNTQRDGLMTYKQFIQELEDDILPSEAEHRYQEYKSEYILTMKRSYFEAHKDQEWLKDKYHPTNLVAVIERRNELARKTASDLLLDLQSGTLVLGPGVNSSSGHTIAQNSDDEVDVGGKRRRQGSAPSKEADVVSGAPKAHPVSSEPRRIQIDIEQAQALVRKLDSEKVIEENILGRVDNGRSNREKSASGPVIIVRGLTSVKGLEGTELLDTLITYLWRVHGVDYYGLVESSEPPKGLRHVRFDGKSSNSDDNINGAEWEKKLDTYWQDRLKGQDPLEIRAAKEKLEAIAVEALDPHVRKIRDEKYGWKYGCGAKGCTKLFHAAEFVHKHLKLKHPELATEMTAKAREELYFQNYMNDADAPGGTPVMQKERQQRRKLGLDQRLKDERGNNRRDWDNRDDRSDNKAQSLDFQSKNNGMAGDSPDEMMFEAYGGHGAPPFPSDIPPPVLMPVPGAGPLGPFIPAPPGVAMRMLRDQGGRPPFEGGGRTGRSGPSPIIALPPSFHQDPRRIRSYQDLDAPDDEVTVIDYRSL